MAHALAITEALARPVKDATLLAHALPLPLTVLQAVALPRALGLAVCDGFEGLAAELAVALALWGPLALCEWLEKDVPLTDAVALAAPVGLAAALVTLVPLWLPLPGKVWLRAAVPQEEGEPTMDWLMMEPLPVLEGIALLLSYDADAERESRGDTVEEALDGPLKVALGVKLGEPVGLLLGCAEPVKTGVYEATPVWLIAPDKEAEGDAIAVSVAVVEGRALALTEGLGEALRDARPLALSAPLLEAPLLALALGENVRIVSAEAVAAPLAVALEGVTE